MHNDLDQVAASPSSKDSISVNTSGTDRPVMRNRLALRHMVKLNAAPSTSPRLQSHCGLASGVNRSGCQLPGVIARGQASGCFLGSLLVLFASPIFADGSGETQDV